MYIWQGNEFSNINITDEELNMFFKRAEEKGLDYEKFWYDIITDNGKHPIESFTCENSQDPDYICDSGCANCHIKT